MIPMNFDKQSEDIKTDAAEQFYKINVENRKMSSKSSRSKIEFLNSWCKKHLSNVKGKKYQLKDLIVAKPEEIKSIKEYIDAQKVCIEKGTREYKSFVGYLYDNMLTSARSFLVESLGLKVCPYCNHTYVFNRKKVSFCDLDHILPKSKYAMFAASFYNLVPACHVCNQKKGDGFFEFNPHDIASHKDILRFRINALSAEVDKGSMDSFDIVIDTLLRGYKDKVDKLKLNELYRCHKVLISEMIQKKKICNEAYIRRLVSEFPELFMDKKTAFEMIYDMTFDEAKFERIPLSKFKYDIYGCI